MRVHGGGTPNSDSGIAGGSTIIPIDGAQEERVARAVAQTYRCARCGYTVRHPEAAVLREMAKEHAEGCR